MLEGRNGNIWISSNRGLYRVNHGQLAAVADGREKLVASIAYGRGDGLLSVECNGGLWPAGAKDSDGSLWFPTQMGVAIVDPKNVHVVQQAPRVIIEQFFVDHKLQPAFPHVTLRPNQANLEVDYTALSSTKPEQLTFSYKLEGIDDDWEPVGLRRTAYFSHLPPGDYTFRVSAQNSNGVRSESDATLQVIVVPPFYRRLWFVALMVVVFLSLLWILWSLRVRQLQREQLRQQNFSRELIASQESERRRIAAELHDSLGQRLIIINNLALFLLRTKGKVRTEEEKHQTVTEINEEASAAIEETRAISYALRPFQLDRLGLTRAIKALCNTVSRASEIEVHADLEDIDDAFPEHLRINVYRIVQEALNNVVKHSGGSQATVAARRARNEVTLTVSDNGRGLPAEPKAATGGPGGFGMTGMSERATLLNGSLQIKSTTGAGTLLIIEIPIQSESVV